MNREDNRKEAMDLKGYHGGFSLEALEWMAHRSREIGRATQRKGMPMTWGAGKGPVKVPPPPKRSGDG